MNTNIQKLISEASFGDGKSFGELYELNVERIFRFVYLRTSHRQSAEDLTSDVFLKAAGAIKRFDSESGNFTAWLYAIARNTIIDHYRTSKSTVDLESIEVLPSLEDLSLDLNNRMLLEKVQKQLLRLPPKEREVVMLRVWDGLSHREISELLGSSESAVKVAYLRGLRKLQAKNITLLLLVFIRYLYE